ncbi:MAG: porin family protein [Salinarimonadaceae bacterium]|nr:MAG: porin family protein [Salinarimonadaceae bacterium]
MERIRLAAIAAATLLAATTPSLAADIAIAAIHDDPPAPPIAIGGGWYLRGDVGVTNQKFRVLTHAELDLFPFEWLDKGKFRPATTIGAGFGYQFNSWFRADVTGEYRSSSNFTARDRYPDAGLPGGFGYNDFSATKSELLTLVNAYLDLGTWSGFTPYIGVGGGFARVDIKNFRDWNELRNVDARAPNGSRWNFAWALHAGFAYDLTDQLKLDVGYRFVSLGKGRTGGPPRAIGAAGGFTTQPWVFNDIYSHDIRAGLRWTFGGPTAVASLPWNDSLIRKY